jgi:hypothetical protein
MVRIVAGLALAVAGSSANADAARDRLAPAVMALNRYADWTLVSATPIGFDAFHPQGMVRIDDAFFVTSVEVLERTKPYPTPQGGFDRDPGRGQGWLFKMNAKGELLASLKLGEGAMYHAGGLDFDGRWLWIPAAEYRPGGPSIVYRVDPQAMVAEEAFRVDDHIGAVAWDSGRRALVGVNWGGEAFYAWTVGKDGKASAQARHASTAHYVGYQDCHGAGPGRILCTGVANYRGLALGGLDLIDVKTWRPLWQAPALAWTPRGAVVTSNAAFLEAAPANVVRGYFLPEDGRGAFYVYDIRRGDR